MEKRILTYSTLYSIGSVGYGIIEILFRGYTHWSMLITGGGCLVALYKINERLPRGMKGFFKKCALGAASITGIEFSVGIIVNKLLHLNVWDYSHLKFNLLGQISLLFTLMWFLLCIPVMPLCEFIRRKS